MYIYALLDPRTEEVRYVGKTTNPRRRFFEHLRKPANEHLARWLNALNQLGLVPNLEILDEVGDETWAERERFWISRFVNLVNINPGGIATPIHSPSPEEREALAARRRGCFVSAETREKLRQRALQNNPIRGKHLSVEHRARIAKAMSKRVVQYTLDNVLVKVWNSVREAVAIHGNGVQKAATGKAKTADGYKWQYEKKVAETGSR